MFENLMGKRVHIFRSAQPYVGITKDIDLTGVLIGTKERLLREDLIVLQLDDGQVSRVPVEHASIKVVDDQNQDEERTTQEISEDVESSPDLFY